MNKKMKISIGVLSVVCICGVILFLNRNTISNKITSNKELDSTKLVESKFVNPYYDSNEPIDKIVENKIKVSKADKSDKDKTLNKILKDNVSLNNNKDNYPLYLHKPVIKKDGKVVSDISNRYAANFDKLKDSQESASIDLTKFNKIDSNNLSKIFSDNIEKKLDSSRVNVVTIETMDKESKNLIELSNLYPLTSLHSYKELEQPFKYDDSKSSDENFDDVYKEVTKFTDDYSDFVLKKNVDEYGPLSKKELMKKYSKSFGEKYDTPFKIKGDFKEPIYIYDPIFEITVSNINYANGRFILDARIKNNTDKRQKLKSYFTISGYFPSIVNTDRYYMLYLVPTVLQPDYLDAGEYFDIKFELPSYGMNITKDFELGLEFKNITDNMLARKFIWQR